VIATAIAKAKIFDSALFSHLSRSAQWRGRASSQYTVQSVAVLLFAFSRVQVDDPLLLDFLERVISEMSPADFTPQVQQKSPASAKKALEKSTRNKRVISETSPADLTPQVPHLALAKPVTQRLTTYTLRPRSYVTRPGPYALNPAPYTLHPTPSASIYSPTRHKRYIYCSLSLLTVTCLPSVQALSVIITVYAGAHRRRSFTSLQVATCILICTGKRAPCDPKKAQYDAKLRTRAPPCRGAV